MRVEKRQVKDQPLTVIVEYPEYDPGVDRLVEKIKHINLSFTGRTEAGIVSVDIAIDLADDNYTDSEVYRYDGSMPDIESALTDTVLVRISRTCIMNTEHLSEIRQIKNSHLEALLDNDEKLIVSRKYLKDIKQIFRRQNL